MALTQVSKDVLNSSQANITQVGTLANLTVTNTIIGSVSGNANNASFLGSIPAANYPNIAAFASSLTFPNGYQKFPGGFMIQWGQFTSSSDSNQTFNFPTAFSTACVQVIISRTDGGGGTAVSSNTDAINTYTTPTGFTFERVNAFDGSILFQYVAFGY